MTESKETTVLIFPNELASLHLSASAIITVSRIFTFTDGGKKPCYIKNSYLMNVFGFSCSSCSNIFKELQEKKIIKTEMQIAGSARYRKVYYIYNQEQGGKESLQGIEETETVLLKEQKQSYGEDRNCPMDSVKNTPHGEKNTPGGIPNSDIPKNGIPKIGIPNSSTPYTKNWDTVYQNLVPIKNEYKKEYKNEDIDLGTQEKSGQGSELIQGSQSESQEQGHSLSLGEPQENKDRVPFPPESEVTSLQTEIIQPSVPAASDPARPSSKEEVLAYFTACKERKIKEYPCLQNYDPSLETETFLNNCISNEWKRRVGGKLMPIKTWKGYANTFFQNWIRWNKDRVKTKTTTDDSYYNVFDSFK